MPPSVQIVVLNWNGAADTMRCVASLQRQTYPNLQIVVIDNGSDDESMRVLSRLPDQVRLVRLGENRGFAGGCNFAMQQAFAEGADYVWLFNNDAEADPDALSVLVAACEADTRVGLASPLVREADDHEAIQFGCGLFDLKSLIYLPSYDLSQTQEWLQQFPDRIALHGTALLVRRSLFNGIGGLDDTFFAYWEDIDYSIRSARAGFRNLAVLQSAIYHTSKPTRRAPEQVKPHYYYFVSRNELLMWRKFCSGIRLAKVAAWTVRRQLRQIARMPDNAAGIHAVLAGLWDGWRGVGGPYDPRRRAPWRVRRLLGQNPGLCLYLLGEATSR
jgi:GT2 family glycosyltransferase